MAKKLNALLILDGYGLNDNKEGNAITLANTKNMDSYFNDCPNCVLAASGEDVGLPPGQMGNSEVGHTNIGAGRIIFQDLMKITNEIKSGEFFKNEALLSAIENCKKNNSDLHLMGLLSDGGVHSHNTHLYALVELAKANGIKNVFIHCFFDGRDVPPNSSLQFIKELQNKLDEIGIGKIASIMGRFYAMDRDNIWDRVNLAYDAMVLGNEKTNDNAIKAVEESYEEKVFDEFVIPTTITDNNKAVGLIKENDSIIFYNFRPDRAREITRAFIKEDFKGFERKNGYFKTEFICMSKFDATFTNVKVAYKKDEIKNNFGEYISDLGLNQLRIAETQKYAHVTFFFNGGVETPYKNEDRVLIDSPKIATFDLQPEMSAYEVKDAVIKEIESEKYDVIVLNFANCDMVGHTGNIPAAIKAVEVVDDCVGQIVKAIKKVNGNTYIMSDHGNADQMLTDEGEVMTAHSTYPVPFIIIGDNDFKLENGKLADVIPTMLELMEIDKPKEMTGKSLIIN